MKLILKRNLTTSPSGQVLPGSNSERLADDGRGRLAVTTRRVATWCQSCHRPVHDIAELRAKCDYCRLRRCCEVCQTKCQVCSRVLCGYCRRGFVGQMTLTVCPICLIRLRQRQAFQDQLLLQKIAFQNRILCQRERTRILALQLQAARARMIGQIQAARLRTMGQLALIREINKARLELAKLRYDYVRHLR